MKLIVGIIAYEDLTAKYLPYFFKSLKEQTFQDFELLIFNNSESENDDNPKIIKEYYPDVKIEGIGKNLGFARAYNFLLKIAFNKKCDYFLAINPDIILETDTIAKMISVLDADKTLGSVCPKVRRWDFKNNKKTNIIDTCGIKLLSGLRFVDIGQGKEDFGQFDNVEILGPSGAAAMYRLTALEKVQYNNQYFDELMFMYKEDCDLAYRLHIAGYKSKCITQSIVYHDRTASAIGESMLKVSLNRRNKSRSVKEWSFLNQQIIIYKFWHLQKFRNKIATIWYEIKTIIFISIFETYLFKQFQEFRRLKKVINRQ